MMIDPHQSDTAAWLTLRAEKLPDGCHLHLLLDGAFVPGLYRSRHFEGSAAVSCFLLFESLPGCTAAVRDASPFLVSIKPAGGPLMERLEARLGACSGWPMVSAIASTESLELVGKRLAAWCVIENDGQRFNFRFPDTRRLPGIFAALSAHQRTQLTGRMHFWSYIARNGRWAELEVAGQDGEMAEDVLLDDEQFGKMVDDATPDEVLFRLAYGGLVSDLPHSLLHAAVCAALKTAKEAGLDETWREAWCEHVVRNGQSQNNLAGLAQWRESVGQVSD